MVLTMKIVLLNYWDQLERFLFLRRNMNSIKLRRKKEMKLWRRTKRGRKGHHKNQFLLFFRSRKLPAAEYTSKTPVWKYWTLHQIPSKIHAQLSSVNFYRPMVKVWNCSSREINFQRQQRKPSNSIKTWFAEHYFWIIFKKANVADSIRLHKNIFSRRARIHDIEPGSSQRIPLNSKLPSKNSRDYHLLPLLQTSQQQEKFE